MAVFTKPVVLENIAFMPIAVLSDPLEFTWSGTRANAGIVEPDRIGK